MDSLFSVKGKIVLVTGGGSGIGKMMAAALVHNGATVYIASRKQKQLEETAKELNALSMNGGICKIIVADLTCKQKCLELAALFAAKEKKLHVLINNAGMTWASPLEDFDEKNGWDRLMALNVKAGFYLTASLLPLLEAAANGNVDPARVINISSVTGYETEAETPLSGPNTGIWSYHASKAAFNHLTRVMASSLAKRFITVNAIAPGVFPSKMTKFGIENAGDMLEMLQPMGRLGSPDDMAGIIIFLASKASAHLTGTVIILDGGSSLKKDTIARL